jgi:hypothetical protein
MQTRSATHCQCQKVGGSVRSLGASLLAAAAVTDTESLFQANAGSEIGAQ